jgi:hypothetical protein
MMKRTITILAIIGIVGAMSATEDNNSIQFG